MKKRNFLALLLVAVLLFITACSGGGGESGGSESSNSDSNGGGSSAQSSSNVGSEDDGELVSLSMFVDEPWWPYSDWSGTMPKWAEEQLGITFDVTVAADYSELELMVASGSMSDVVVSGKFNVLSNPNTCYDWGSLMEEYNIEGNIHPAYQYVNQADDGKFYTVMVGWSADYEYVQYPRVYPEGNGAAAREDILKVAYERLGINSIGSLEDLENALQVCVDEFPGVTPYTFNGDWTKDRYMHNLFGLVENGFVDEGNGVAKLWINQEKRKDYYLKLNEWYQKGYLIEENFTWSNISTQYEWGYAGELFVAGMFCSTADQLDLGSAEAGVDYTWVQLTDIQTPDAKILTTSPGWRGFFITKSCKNPEAAIRYANFAVQKDTQYTMMWGVEGVDWKWNADKTVAEFEYNINTDTDKIAELQLRWGWLGHDGISNNMYTVAMGGKTADGKEWVNKITERNPVLGMVLNSMSIDSDEYVIYQNLIELEKNVQTNIIFASSAEEALVQYEEMMKQANNLGAAQVEEWANAQYVSLYEGYKEVKDIGPEGWN